MSPSWLQDSGDGSLIVLLYVQPNARKNAFVGQHGQALKLRLAAPPVEGKANLAMCRFLAETCGIARSRLTLISGESSRTKRVRIEAADEVLRQRLCVLGETA